MSLGYDGKLFILAFDHRDSFKEKMFGIIDREATPAEQEQLRGSKGLIWEGFHAALRAGAPAAAAGILVDEEMGAAVARAAKEAGILLTMPVEKSGQDIFDFEYGEDFGAHIEAFDPAFAKVLVRWNPVDAPEVKKVQAERLRRLGSWLQERGRKFLFELLVPATPHQLALAGGSAADYDAHIRPYLMLEAIFEIQEAGIEPDVWKLEGIATAEDCALVSAVARRGGRNGVKAVVLGRGADDAQVEHWVRAGSGVPGYVGFAIGRTIWWNGVKAWKEGTLTRAQAAAAIGTAYRRFIDVYEGAGR
jgi:myo-inositol catabolism protein IolC